MNFCIRLAYVLINVRHCMSSLYLVIHTNNRISFLFHFVPVFFQIPALSLSPTHRCSAKEHIIYSTYLPLALAFIFNACISKNESLLRMYFKEIHQLIPVYSSRLHLLATNIKQLARYHCIQIRRLGLGTLPSWTKPAAGVSISIQHRSFCNFQILSTTANRRQ